jgi:hypothetical protein
MKEADADYAKVKHNVHEGTHTGRWNGTVSEMLDA